MKSVSLDKYGYLPYSVTVADNFFRIGEVVKFGDGGYAMIISEYTLRKVNISRWWLIRKIQLWAIKKAFK